MSGRNDTLSAPILRFWLRLAGGRWHLCRGLGWIAPFGAGGYTAGCWCACLRRWWRLTRPLVAFEMRRPGPSGL